MCGIFACHWYANQSQEGHSITPPKGFEIRMTDMCQSPRRAEVQANCSSARESVGFIIQCPLYVTAHQLTMSSPEFGTEALTGVGSESHDQNERVLKPLFSRWKRHIQEHEFVSNASPGMDAAN